jgi:ABC-type transport system involved in multi-copper enzyme maturation permease subunit
MRAIRCVAVNVFRESVRDKVLYNLVVFAVLLISVSFLIGQLTAGQDIKIIKDLGLAAISLFGVAIAVFIGIGLVWKEVDKRSIYSILAKPVRRSEFVLGKYLGLVLTLLVNVVVMTLAFYAVLGFMQWRTDPLLRAAWTVPAVDVHLLPAIGLIAIELSLVTALALLFSTFSSPFLSAALTVGLWIAGQFAADLRNLGELLPSPAAGWMARAVSYLLPDFAAFDVKSQVVYGQAVDAQYFMLTSAYGVTYLTLTLLVAVLIFSRRDFK